MQTPEYTDTMYALSQQSPSLYSAVDTYNTATNVSERVTAYKALKQEAEGMKDKEMLSALSKLVGVDHGVLGKKIVATPLKQRY